MITDTLTYFGIQRAPEVVTAANAAGLELAVAAAMLMRESGGGRNVWGHDNVDTGGCYVKGAPVDRAAYLRYRTALQARRIGAQGCGPTQLTAPALQQLADQAGGCYDWTANVRTGFSHLAGLISAHGLADGLRRYNGSGPDAERYRDEMLDAVAQWRGRLGSTNPPTPAPSPVPRPRPAGDDVAWTKSEGAPPVPDYYPGATADLPDPLTALAWATAHAGMAASSGDDMRRTLAVLVEGVRALTSTVQSIARLLALDAPVAPAPMTAAELFTPAAPEPVATAPLVDHAELVRQLLAQLGVTPAAPTPTPEGTTV